MTIRAYPYIEVDHTTKRAILVRVANKDKLIRVPKKDTEFKTDVRGRKVMLVDDIVAEFIGLVDEVTL
jgi:pyrimidine operon attenuation protein/uracil phosphoribosyltransferase